MEARFMPAIVLLILVVSMGANVRTANFIVEAPTPELAEKIAKAAEKFRRELAIEWLGEPMPNWSKPCPIVAEVAPHLGAGGQTSFVFDRGEVFGWDMKVQGSEQRVLDSVLPHEVTHTIFASHFRCPLPRWADEGACTTVEHVAERTKQQHMLIEFLKTQRGIAFHKMFAMKDYPRDVLPLYSQGYSLARFFIEQGGRRKFMQYVGDGLKSEDWAAVTKRHYGYENLAVLQDQWLDWVKQGSPPLDRGASEEMLASSGMGRGDAPTYRAQSEDRQPLRNAQSDETQLAALEPLPRMKDSFVHPAARTEDDADSRGMDDRTSQSWPVREQQGAYERDRFAHGAGEGTLDDRASNPRDSAYTSAGRTSVYDRRSRPVDSRPANSRPFDARPAESTLPPRDDSAAYDSPYNSSREPQRHEERLAYQQPRFQPPQDPASDEGRRVLLQWSRASEAATVVR